MLLPVADSLTLRVITLKHNTRTEIPIPLQSRKSTKIFQYCEHFHSPRHSGKKSLAIRFLSPNTALLVGKDWLNKAPPSTRHKSHDQPELVMALMGGRRLRNSLSGVEG